MKIRDRINKNGARKPAGFTLVEVVMSLAILGVAVPGVILGYVRSAERAEWTAHSLAAESLAMQTAEQARSAKWDTQAWPQGVGPGQSDELGTTNFVQVETLDVPMHGAPVYGTNFVRVTTISDNPAIRQIQCDCVWRFMGRGLYTNSVFMLRAPDQ